MFLIHVESYQSTLTNSLTAMLVPTAGRYDAGGKIVSFVFCNGERRKQVFHKFQTLEFDPVRLQIFAKQSRKKPVNLEDQRRQARDDLANSFLWLKQQGGTGFQHISSLLVAIGELSFYPFSTYP